MAPNVTDFNLDLQKFAQAIGDHAEAGIKKIALDLFSVIVERTPIDTGRLKGSWTINMNESGHGDIGEQNPKLSDMEASNKAHQQEDKARSFKLGDQIYITNAVEYGEYIECGTDRIKPFAMVALSVADAETKLANFLSKSKI